MSSVDSGFCDVILLSLTSLSEALTLNKLNKIQISKIIKRNIIRCPAYKYILKNVLKKTPIIF